MTDSEKWILSLATDYKNELERLQKENKHLNEQLQWERQRVEYNLRQREELEKEVRVLRARASDNRQEIERLVKSYNELYNSIHRQPTIPDFSRLGLLRNGTD